MSKKSKKKYPIKIEKDIQRKAMVLSAAAKEMIADYERKQRPPNRFNNFKMPECQPVSNGESGGLTTDSLPINQYNFSPFDKINQTLLNSWFLGYQELALLTQNGIIQNIIQCQSQDCVREWISIFSESTDENSGSKKKIKKIERAFKKLKVRAHIKKACEQMFAYGGCKIYPKIRGDDSIEGGAELLNPFTIDKCGKGDLLYLKVIEPQYATPVKYNVTDPLADDFYVPSEYVSMGKTINASRLLHFAYNDVPTILKPVYWFNGMPLVQLCLDYLYGFESIRQNIVGISGRYNINVFSTNMTALLDFSSGSSFQEGQDALSRLKLAQALMTNFSIFALDNNPEAPEQWQQFNMTIAGLSDILTTNAELVCGVCRVPAVKLFGTSPKGFNATGDNELRLYYDLISSYQESNIRPALERIFELVQMSLFGEVDPDLDFEFKPLWKMSAIEKSTIQKDKQIINSGYINDNVLQRTEVREALAKDPDSGYSDLKNLSEESLQENEPDDEE